MLAIHVYCHCVLEWRTRGNVAQAKLQLGYVERGIWGKGEELKYNWKAGKGDEARVEEDSVRVRRMRREVWCFWLKPHSLISREQAEHSTHLPVSCSSSTCSLSRSSVIHTHTHNRARALARARARQHGVSMLKWHNRHSLPISLRTAEISLSNRRSDFNYVCCRKVNNHYTVWTGVSANSDTVNCEVRQGLSKWRTTSSRVRDETLLIS